MSGTVYLEAPLGALIDQRELEIRGWCASEMPFEAVEVNVNGVACTVSYLDRPDVLSVHPGRHVMGFMAKIDLLGPGVIKGKQRVLLEVVVEGVGRLGEEFEVEESFRKLITNIQDWESGAGSSPRKVLAQPLGDAARRRLFLEKHVDLRGISALEIGALDNPTYRPEEINIKYLDWFTTEENFNYIKDLPTRNPKALVKVDYPIKSKRFSQHLDRKFDLIIANHVIEHIPDLIRWLKELEQSLMPGGRLFLSIPDRNYTFDYLQSETDIAEIMRCYEEDLEEPNYAQILRYIYKFRPIVAVDIWTGTAGEKLRQRRYTVPQAVALAKDMLGKGHSVHCSYFSRETFPFLWDELVETGLIGLRLTKIGSVQEGTNEFHVLLRNE